MKKIGLLFLMMTLIALTSFHVVAHAENWVQFSKTRGPGFRIYYDTDSIRLNEKCDVITFRLKSLNPQLAGMVQICDMELRETYLKMRLFSATMLNKKVYDVSGKLVKEEGREGLGTILRTDWDFLEEVAVYAGTHGMYPKGRILNINQYDEVVIQEQFNVSKMSYFTQSINATSKGIEFDLWFQEAKSFPQSVVYHCLLKDDGTVRFEEGRLYYMRAFVSKEKVDSEAGNWVKSPNENFRKAYADIKKVANR